MDIEVSNLDQVPEPYRSLLKKAGLGASPLGGPVAPPAGVDEMAFMQRVFSIVEVVRNAELSRQWDMARPFMSSRLFRRWQPWAAGLKTDASPAASDEITREIFMAAFQSELGHDRATARLLESHSTSRQPPVATLWTFLRSAAGEGGVTGAASVCTYCGAPVNAMTETVCKYCGAGLVVLGPEWIVDDIAVDASGASAAA